MDPAVYLHTKFNEIGSTSHSDSWFYIKKAQLIISKLLIKYF